MSAASVSDATAAAAAAAPPVAPSSTGASVDVRQKTRDMIESAMREALSNASSETADESDASSSAHTQVKDEFASLPCDHLSSLATSIESALLFSCSRVVGAPYRHRARSLVFNLRRNSLLALRLVRGTLTPYALSQLSEDQLATASTRAEREANRAADIAASIAKSAARIPSRDYRCPACGGVECSTRILREERDIPKADTWGSKQGAGSVIEIYCDTCQNTWTKEE